MFRGKPGRIGAPLESLKRKKPPKVTSSLAKKRPAKAIDKVVEIKGHDIQKGDNTSRIEPMLRAKKPTGMMDIHVNLDPSHPQDHIPENQPKTGKLDQPLPPDKKEDESLNLTGQVQRDPDDVAQQKDKSTMPESKKDRNLLEGENILGIPEKGKDTVSTVKPGYSPSDAMTRQGFSSARQDILRPLFGMANPMQAIPSVVDQIKSGLLFNDFHMVAPGWGLGVNNKMFLMEENHEKKVRFHEPLDSPREYYGPTDGPTALPFEWQNEFTSADLSQISKENRLASSLMRAVRDLGGKGSLNILGDDYGLLRSSSMKGLPRPPESPFEPVNIKPPAMMRERPLTGFQLQKQVFRRLFDGQRWPTHLENNIAQEGGSTYTTQKALRLLPFPVGTA